jgi:hypothetical protein
MKKCPCSENKIHEALVIAQIGLFYAQLFIILWKFIAQRNIKQPSLRCNDKKAASFPRPPTLSDPSSATAELPHIAHRAPRGAGGQRGIGLQRDRHGACAIGLPGRLPVSSICNRRAEVPRPANRHAGPGRECRSRSHPLRAAGRSPRPPPPRARYGRSTGPNCRPRSVHR